MRHGWRVQSLYLMLCVVPLGLLTGCFRGEPIRTEQLGRGYILLLPGVENTTWSMAGIVAGLRDAGIEQAIDIDQWGVKIFGTFPNLTGLEANRKSAQRMAEKLVQYQRSHPGEPVTIIGYSGGGGLALMTAEFLPAGHKVDRLVLLGAAVSPQYDLSKAIANSRYGVVNFYSPSDWFMVGWGTRTFGTIDRVKTDAAGRVGFQDAAGHLLEREGLTQIRYRRSWKALHHAGGHSGWLARAWASEVLAPMVPSASVVYLGTGVADHVERDQGRPPGGVFGTQ